MELVKETAEVCKLILEHTHWQIRLLSKSNLLPNLAHLIPDKWKGRMIYGVSTGTLDDKLAKAFENGTPLVSKRIQSLQQLQDEGYRTYGMICPSLPQDDYDQFSKEMCDAIRVDRCEHVWAEVINLRGKSFTRTIDALTSAGLEEEANRLRSVKNGDEWEAYARETFLAHQKHIDPSKLRFMQYVKASTLDWWKEHEQSGALLLGKAAIRPGESTLTTVEKSRFKKLNIVITAAAKSFVDAGMALYEIRSKKLYRDNYKTFEEYCQSVHSISRQYANKLIKAGKVTSELETIVSKAGVSLPKNEAQVRELARVLEVKDRGEVYCDALESVDGDEKLLTAKVIKSFVDQKLPEQKVTIVASSSARLKEARGIIEQLESQYADGGDLNDLIGKLKAIVGGLRV